MTTQNNTFSETVIAAICERVRRTESAPNTPVGVTFCTKKDDTGKDRIEGVSIYYSPYASKSFLGPITAEDIERSKKAEGATYSVFVPEYSDEALRTAVTLAVQQAA
ncbi:MAG: hypothetical protein LBL91_02015 [Lachnospiraceae bacterium]|jgi:effector-binding domain-containing protein|nr:hypothetical protein [Lachnospiraceae bacterium]